MTSWINALAFAVLLSTIFAFRFETWRHPIQVVLYFLLFFGIEIGIDVFLMPPGAIGIEVAIVCAALTVPFGVATWLSIRFKSRDDSEH